jgi:hypothetical protein
MNDEQIERLHAAVRGTPEAESQLVKDFGKLVYCECGSGRSRHKDIPSCWDCACESRQCWEPTVKGHSRCAHHLSAWTYRGQKDSAREIQYDLRALQHEILRRAVIAIAPYRRALCAIEDAGVIFESAHYANGDTWGWGVDDASISMWSDGKGFLTGVGNGYSNRSTFLEVEAAATKERGSAKDLVEDVKVALGEVEGPEWSNDVVPAKFCREMIDGGLLDKLKAAMTYIGDEDESSPTDSSREFHQAQ